MANIKIPQLGSAQSINDNDYLIVDDGLSTLKVTAEQIKGYATNDVKAEIAPEWEEDVSYPAGAFVNWNGKLKKCLQAHTSSEALTPANGTYWKNDTVGDEIEDLNQRTNDIEVGTLTFLTPAGFNLSLTTNSLIHKMGHLVRLKLQFEVTKCSEATDYILMNLPEGYRPKGNGVIVKNYFLSLNNGYLNGIGTGGGIYTLSVGSNGVVKFRSATATSSGDGMHFVNLDAMYFVD